jgi:adenosylcobinamide kinase/adenosylcobinamide-phosphate guanylyltransferase
MIELVVGGARSGKSTYAQQRAESLFQQSGNTSSGLYYLATAQALDGEMNERIERHKSERDNRWATIEEPLDIASIIADNCNADKNTTILIDCLTLWLSNALHAGDEAWQTHKTNLLTLLEQQSVNSKTNLIFVSNEVGQGIIPMDALSRRFVDEAGWLHQAIAKVADKVTVVQFGIPTAIKS